MKRSFRASAVFAALIGAFALSLPACTTDVAPSAPRAPDVAAIGAQPPNLLGLDLDGTITGVVSNITLYRCSTPSFGSVTQEIGPGGGVVLIGPHSLVIPAGALDQTVAITASTSSGDYVRVDFRPEGLRFKYAAVLGLSYAHCDRPPLLPSVAYVDDLLGVLELLPAVNDLESERVTTKLRHFSGYAIAD